jgi:hypothetical protein
MLFPKEHGPDLAPQPPCPRGRGHTTTNRGNSVSDNRFPHELLLILAIKSLAGNAQPSLAITKVTPKCRLLRATTNSSIGPALSSARAPAPISSPSAPKAPRGDWGHHYRGGPGHSLGRAGRGSQAFACWAHVPRPFPASRQLIVVIAGQERDRHSIVEDRCNQVTIAGRPGLFRWPQREEPMAEEDCPFEVVCTNGSDEVLVYANNLLIGL